MTSHECMREHAFVSPGEFYAEDVEFPKGGIVRDKNKTVFAFVGQQ